MSRVICHCCLKEAYNFYCDTCIEKLFSGKKVNHQLSFTKEEFDKNHSSQDAGYYGEYKYEISLDKRNFVLSPGSNQYILKPIPAGNIENKEFLPANEHLTMQIAKQVYNIDIVENALIYFRCGEVAYLAKGLDIQKFGHTMIPVDFAQKVSYTDDLQKLDVNYDNYSYEEIVRLSKRFIGAYQVEIEKIFQIIMFNYLFSNYEANLKNFSLYSDENYGDYYFTPFYDLKNTELHLPNKTVFSMPLFDDSGGFKEAWEETQKVKPYFKEFADRVGINDKRFDRMYSIMISNKEQVEKLVFNSFLNEELKIQYFDNYKEKLANLTAQ